MYIQPYVKVLIALLVVIGLFPGAALAEEVLRE